MSSTATTGRRWVQAGAVALAIALAVSACGTGTATPEDTATSGTGVNADRTAVLKTTITTQTKFLDPIRLGDPGEWNILTAVYDTLLYRDQETNELIPGLATEWEQTDDVTLKLTLREGVKFQDGTDFNADAVVFNFNRALTDPNSSVKNSLYMLKYVKAVDDLTVEFNVDPTVPAFGPLLDSFTQRPGMIASPDAVAGGGANFISEAAGAGMYEVENFNPGVGAAVRAWDGYWNPDAALLGGIEWVSSPGDPAPLLLSNAVDVLFITQASLAPIAADPNITVVTRPGIQYYVLGINETLAPFDDEKVRQAAAYAIDRELLATTMGYEAAQWQPLPPGSIGYTEELDSVYSYDPDKARELLDEAGYPDGGVAVHFLIGQQATAAVRALEIVQAMLEEVGFVVEIELADLATVLPRYLGDRKTNCGTANGGFFLAKLSSSDPDALFRARYLKDSPQNAGCNEPSWLRAAVDEAAAETDDAVRGELYAAISERAQAEVLDGVPLYVDTRNTGFWPYVGGIEFAYTNYDADWHGVYITEGRVPVE